MEHCKTRITHAELIKESEIEFIGDRHFKVQSSTDSSLAYEVYFGSDNEMPSCDCHDWKNHHWSWKHFIAIFQQTTRVGMGFFGSGYCQSPMFRIHEQGIAAVDIPELDQVSLEGIMNTNEVHPCVPSESARVPITKYNP